MNNNTASNNFFNNNKILNNANKPNNKRTKLIIAGVVLLLLIVFVGFYFFNSSGEDVDCQVGSWSDYKDCTTEDECPSGTNRFRTRTVTTKPQNKGKACGDLVEHVNAVDCEWRAWSDWRACEDGECVPGKNQIRTRTKLVEENQYGTCVGQDKDYHFVEPTHGDSSGDSGSSSSTTLGGSGSGLGSSGTTLGGSGLGSSSSDTTLGGLGSSSGSSSSSTTPGGSGLGSSSGTTLGGSGLGSSSSGSSSTTLGGSGLGSSSSGSSSNTNSEPESDTDVYPLIETVPAWAQGKMCSDNPRTSYCLMPFGAPCASGKEILQSDTLDQTVQECTDATKDALGVLPGQSFMRSFYTSVGPAYCSYLRNPDTNNGNRKIHVNALNKSTPRNVEDYMAVCKNT